MKDKLNVIVCCSLQVDADDKISCKKRYWIDYGSQVKDRALCLCKNVLGNPDKPNCAYAIKVEVL